MSTLSYNEPHRFSAGALALVVHAAFFSLLYFSINWHVKTPPNIVVEMWNTLPDRVIQAEPTLTTPPPPPPPPVVQKAEKVSAHKEVEPVAPKKADIEFKEKKKTEPAKIIPQKKEEPITKPVPKQDDSARKLAIENQRKLDEQQKIEKMRVAAEQAVREEERQQQRLEKIRAENEAANNAAMKSEMERFVALIRAKISRNINLPPDVPDNAEAIFTVTMLPGGSVMNIKLEKSSGNIAYDNAAERAIYKAQPLPLPADPEIARMFHDLKLHLKPASQ